MKILAILIILYSLIFARQNPFKPMIDETVLPATTNKVEKLPNFKKLRIELPSDARALESIKLLYKSVDGSVKTTELKINKTINWHKPIFLYQKIDKKDKKDKWVYKSINPLSFISFRLMKSSVKIVTNDKKIRKFHLTNPFRVVIDFKREANFLTKRVKLRRPPFIDLNIGNHNGFYRVVIVFDSSYRYKIEKIDGGYILNMQ